MSRVLDLIAALAGNPSTGEATEKTTPAQFDNDKSLATTDFVQRALGNMAGNATVAGPTGALAVADAGKRIRCMATTLNLPDAALLPDGATFHVSFANGAATINPAAGDTIYAGSLLVAGGSASAPNGSSATITKTEAHTWVMMGSAVAKYEDQYLSTQAQNGALRLPGGLLVQWGVAQKDAATSPLAIAYGAPFPAHVFAVIAGIVGSQNPNGGAVSASWGASLTQFNAYTTTGYPGAYISWIAIGN